MNDTDILNALEELKKRVSETKEDAVLRKLDELISEVRQLRTASVPTAWHPAPTITDPYRFTHDTTPQISWTYCNTGFTGGVRTAFLAGWEGSMS